MESLTKNSKLTDWQERYEEAKQHYDKVLTNIQDNMEAYDGTRKIKTPDGTDAEKQGSVSRKMCFELTETQADIVIPMPKVVSKKGREDRSMMIESVIRNEIENQPMEEIIDEQARITPVTGGSVFFVEWDNTIKNAFGVGGIRIKNLDPRQVIPQPGVYKIQDMDYIFLRFQQSKFYIKRNYGIDVEHEGDEGDEPLDDMRTHIFCYYRNDNGNIGLLSWVGDTVIQDYDDYFYRKQKVCKKCGTVKDPSEDKCLKCGGKKFILENKEDEEITYTERRNDPDTGMPIENEKKVKVKYYVPKIFPIVVRKNVCVLNSFLGSSDIDFIKDQQNDMNILMNKIREKMLKGGSYITLPEGVDLKANDEELKIIRVNKPSDLQLITVNTIQPNVATDAEILELNYEIGRQTLGITDSYQGRRDTTATSGKAREIAIQQSAGRLKSKQTMKDYAFAELYKLIFTFLLAYTDEQRPYIEEHTDGSLDYKWFDKRFFIDEDTDGNLYYDDEFTFSVDVAGTLANDRQSMWKETRSNFESGAYGDPKSLDTLEMYWTTMNKLHYPCAPDALKLIKQRREEQERLAQQQMQTQALSEQLVKSQTQRLLAENLDQQRKLNDYEMKKTQDFDIDSVLGNLGI